MSQKLSLVDILQSANNRSKENDKQKIGKKRKLPEKFNAGSVQTNKKQSKIDTKGDKTLSGASESSTTLKQITTKGSGVPQAATKGALKIRKPAETVVSIGDSSLKYMVSQKREEFAAYHKKVSDAESKLTKVLDQLSNIKRTRRNLRLYNDLVDQREALGQELTLLRINRPDESSFYDNLKQFLKANQTSLQQKPTTELNKVENAIDKNENLETAAGGQTAAKKIPEAVQLQPKHHSLTVTSGAPVFDFNQFELLCLMRADIQQKLERSVHGNVEQSRVEKSRLQFSAIVAKEIRSQLNVDQFAAPLMFVLSPVGTGVPSPCTAASVEKIRQGLQEWNETVGDKDNSSTKKPIMVTIGKDNDEDPRDVGMRRKQSNRINVKMKDIRNMQNKSVLNYVKVHERTKTKDEVQHANFKQFLAQKSTEVALLQRPRYSEDVCEECDEDLDVNVHTGMVSCPNCGVCYSDGIDCHQWQAVAHVPHSKFEYLKSGHLNTLLKRVQGKEATVIPRDIIDKVLVYLSKKNYDLNTLTFKRMKNVLKKLHLNKYYDHVWQLLYIIADIQPIQFTEEEELAFQAVFDVLEEIYPIYKPKNYENFIFYWYIIGKTAQLLGHPQEIVDIFPLLKNPRKHQQKERIWRKMMNHVSWPYFVTYHDVEARRMLIQE